MEEKRLGIRRKETLVLRLLHGEPLEMLAAEADVTPDELLELKQRFVRAGREGLKTRRSGKPA